MGFKNSTSNAKANTSALQDYARAVICGTVNSIYVGKKYAYVTIRVKPGEYYTDYKVAFPLDYTGDATTEGARVSIHADISTYYNKEKRATETNYTYIKDVDASDYVSF